MYGNRTRASASLSPSTDDNTNRAHFPVYLYGMHPDTIETCSLASGSKGNSYFFRTTEHSFLVDAGISCLQIKKRLQTLGADIQALSGIFLTHEHSDHSRGLATIAKQHRIPLYLNKKTAARLRHQQEKSLLKYISYQKPILFGGTAIHARPKFHDVADPCFFIISHAGKNIPVLTDLGKACAHAISATREADALYLETNYDPEMLEEGPYPEDVKIRVDSVRGHLSNRQAAILLRESATPRLRHIFLSHISENNNTPSLARKAIRETLEERSDLAGVRILTAPQDGISKIVRL